MKAVSRPTHTIAFLAPLAIAVATVMITFGMASAMAAAAGVMLSIIYSFWPGSGVDFIQKCFAIIIIGGMGNFVGAFYGEHH